MIKIWIKEIILMVCLISLTGCSEIRNLNATDFTGLDDGFYLLKNEDIYALSDYGQTDRFTLNQIALDSSEIITLTSDEYNTVPKVTNNDQLILVSNEDLTEPVRILPLNKIGTTIGIEFAIKDGAIKPEIGGIVKNSKCEAILSEINGINSFRLISVGGQKVTESDIKENGYLNNLNENDTYQCIFQKGTKEIKVDLPADTMIFQTKPGNYQKINHLTYTENGYALLNLPSLDNGMYLVLFSQGRSFKGGIFEKS